MSRLEILGVPSFRPRKEPVAAPEEPLDGVYHLSDLVDDILDNLLNLQKMRLLNHGKKPQEALEQLDQMASEEIKKSLTGLSGRLDIAKRDDTNTTPHDKFDELATVITRSLNPENLDKFGSPPLYRISDG